MRANIQVAYLLDKEEFLYVDEHLLSVAGLVTTDLKVDLLLSKLFADDMPFLTAMFRKLLNGGSVGTVRFRVAGLARQEWLSLTPFMEENQEGRVLFGNCTVVTDEVSNYEAMTRYANKKNAILHMLGHDLRGPLHTAQSLMHMLDGMTKDPAVQKRTRHVSTIIARSIDLITDLVSREFLETVDIALVKHRVNIAERIREYLDECSRSATIARRKFEFYSDHEEVFVALDEAKFMQIVNNLVSNALKFTTEDGIIAVKIYKTEDGVRFIFQDDGIGIPEELLPVLFDRFSAARRNGLRGEQTVGLGLSICKDIVEWHDGIIVCESIENEGTTFIINIPG